MMGFRCPKCHKDFGIDRIKFYEHIIKNRVDMKSDIKSRLELERAKLGVKQ